jgi:hypothetical protein
MPADPASHRDPATTLFRISWDETHEVIRFVWVPGAVCDAREAEEGTVALRAAFDRPLPLLVDMRTMAKLERGAREHYKHDKGGVAAMALLVGSPVTRMMANFFMRTDVDATPTRMFTDEVAALAWLGDHRP